MNESKNFQTGFEFSSVTEVGKYQSIIYAGASGDFNPIHIDPEVGEMVGLGGVILHGLCTAAFVSRTVVDAAGGDPRSLRKLKVRFAAPVKPLDTVTVHGKVTDLREGNAICELAAYNQDGKQVISNAFAVVRG